MEMFKHVKPTKEYEQQAIEFINEFYQYKSEINGVGGLNRFLDDYDGWLLKLEEDRSRVPNEEKVPAETFFLVRESDNKIVGMINIRLVLNERMEKFGGHIGYCIRPTERRKGYNKINLYLGLKEAQKFGLDRVMLDCASDNIGSYKTMEAIGGVFDREEIDPSDGLLTKVYYFDVNECLLKNEMEYEKYIANDEKNRMI